MHVLLELELAKETEFWNIKWTELSLMSDKGLLMPIWYASIGIATSSIETRAKIVRKARLDAPKLQKESKNPKIHGIF